MRHKKSPAKELNQMKYMIASKVIYDSETGSPLAPDILIMKRKKSLKLLTEY